MSKNPIDGFKTGEHTDLSPDTDHYYTIEQIRLQTEPGEMLEFKRGFYTQYGLYLGNDKVVNIDSDDGKANIAHIREGTLEDCCDVVTVRVRNLDKVAKAHFNLTPKPTEEIVNAALSYINKTVPYEFENRNGEYYCTLWRYGSGFSIMAAKRLLDQ